MGFIEALRLPPGPVDLDAIDTRAVPEWPGTSSNDKDTAAGISASFTASTHRSTSACASDPDPPVVFIRP